MLQATPCPASDLLKQFLLGQLPLVQAEVVEQHLLRCGPCVAQAPLLDAKDDVIRAMRAATAPTEFDGESIGGLRDWAAKLQSPLPLDDGEAPVTAPLDVCRDRSTDCQAIDQSTLPYRQQERVSAPGQVVAGYEIISELGRGGMGVVYKARHVGLNRLVALKMILGSSHAGDEVQHRFRAEAEAVARLKHPNIVQIYDIGESAGLPYFSLELVEGGALSAQVANATWQAKKAAPLVATLARAMHVAHGAGIIHRDLKPGNVLLTCDGIPKITDFGLAKRLEDEGRTVSGAVLGTPSYMAPEQAAGETKRIGPACDVYALAAILYHLLTGRPPFVGATTWDTLDQVRNQEPVSPRSLEAKLPRDLETICLKGLQKNPQQRYSSALELAEDLERFAKGESIRARPISTPERLLKWARRQPKDAALTVIGVLTLLLLFAGGWWYQAARARNAEDKNRRWQIVEQLVRECERAREQAVTEDDWQRARDQATQALAMSRDDAALQYLHAQAEAVYKDASRRLEAGSAGRTAREKLAQFRRLRDQALFHETMVSGPSSIQEVRSHAQAALALFPQADLQEPFIADERKEITDSRAELLLVLSEATAHVVEGKNEDPRTCARAALQLLEQAEKLGGPTRSTLLRRARYLEQAGNTEESSQIRHKAEQLQPVEHRDLFFLGLDAYRSRNLQAAKAYFSDALRKRANHYWTQHFLALCQLTLKEWSQAEAGLTACLSMQPEFIWLHQALGQVHTELHAYSAALADFARAEQLLSKTPDPTAEYSLLNNRGVLWLRHAEHEALATEVGAALAHTPLNPWNIASSLRPLCYLQAVADFSEATRRNPQQYQAYVNLAQAYRGLRRFDDSMAAMDQAVARQADVAALFRTRSQIHQQRGDWTRATADLSQAIALADPARDHPQDVAQDFAQRGRLRQQHFQDFAGAVADLERSLELHPAYLAGHYLRAGALLKLQRFKEASEALDQYLREERGVISPEVYRLRGRIRAFLRDLPGAVADFSRVLDIGPDVDAFVSRGWLFHISEAPRLALDDFEKALQADGRNAEAYAGRGLAFAKLGQFSKAIADARKAEQLGRTDVRVLYEVARVYAQVAGQLDRDLARQSRLDREQPSRYQDQAVALLRRALELEKPELRRAFWQRTVMDDKDLLPIRRNTGFIALAMEFGRATK